jgi:hypothetical protein
MRMRRGADGGGQCQLADLRNHIDEQVRAALLDVGANKQLVDVARSNVDLATRALSDETDRVNAGVDDNLPLVTAQATLASAENNLVESLYQYNVSKLAWRAPAACWSSSTGSYLGRVRLRRELHSMPNHLASPRVTVERQVRPDAAEAQDRLLRRAECGRAGPAGRAVFCGDGRGGGNGAGGAHCHQRRVNAQGAFKLLADPAQPWRARMPWDKLDLWWVDERCVPPDDPDSNYRMTREAMLDHVPLKPEQIHRMEGELEPEEAAARYESELRKALPAGGRGAARFDLVRWGWVRMDTLRLFFPTPRPLHEMGGW